MANMALLISIICVGISVFCLIQNIKISPSNKEKQETKCKNNIMYITCRRVYGTRFTQKPKLLIVDTGASSNFINKKFIQTIYPQYKDHILYGDDVLTANGSLTLNELIEIPMQIGNNLDVSEDFTLLQDDEIFQHLSDETGLDVIGIVGFNFLQKHNYVVDCKNKLLYRHKI